MTRRQCKTCPWRVGNDRSSIPGYSEQKAIALASTIATPGALDFSGPLQVMACHYSTPADELPCVGWIANQLGDGNNVRLRIACSRGVLDADVKTEGEQHARYADTLPAGALERGLKKRGRRREQRGDAEPAADPAPRLACSHAEHDHGNAE